MLYNSFPFLCFFPVVVLVYYVIPRRVRYIWLLAASYYFYMSRNVKHVLFLLTVTVLTYLCGILLDRTNRSGGPDDKKRTVNKGWTALCVLPVFGLLLFFKLIPEKDVLMPLGISFYTFQSVGYVIDVFRGKSPAEKNFLKYALFVSFFPTLLSGPIERSDHLLRQIKEENRFDPDNIKTGLCLMLWGYFLKLVMADRIAVFVNAVFAKETGGLYAMIAIMLFGVQLYCDFMGYSVLAMGAARVMGFRVIDNFKAPYMAVSVADFWRRWHISLTSWFRDYLYIPLGGSRKGVIRKYANIMIVFLVSGFWHGVGWKYIIWGGMNGAYQVMGYILEPLRRRAEGRLPRKGKSALYRGLCTVVTFLLVSYAFLFFRAESARSALRITGKMFTEFSWSALADGSLYTFGLGKYEFWFMLLTVVFLVVVDLIHDKGYFILELIQKIHWSVRSCICAVFFMAVIIFGIYGVNYDVGTFIYFAF